MHVELAEYAKRPSVTREIIEHSKHHSAARDLIKGSRFTEQRFAIFLAIFHTFIVYID